MYVTIAIEICAILMTLNLISTFTPFPNASMLFPIGDLSYHRRGLVVKGKARGQTSKQNTNSISSAISSQQISSKI